MKEVTAVNNERCVAVALLTTFSKIEVSVGKNSRTARNVVQDGANPNQPQRIWQLEQHVKMSAHTGKDVTRTQALVVLNANMIALCPTSVLTRCKQERHRDLNISTTKNEHRSYLGQVQGQQSQLTRRTLRCQSTRARLYRLVQHR